ncbi:hypothetical protein Tco_1294443 [Tanacetum coccineum]
MRIRGVPIPVTAPESGPSTALKMIVPSTTEEKICKKNDVKARSLLLMALPNKHQLTFNQYVDAQSMFAAIKARFGGNEATKRTQKALLKQQLAILGVVTPPEDLNVKFLRSLPSEWDTHVVVWINKPDFDTIGLDDLYNNFKIVEQKVKRSTGAINDEKNLAFLTTSGASSTKNINTVNSEVSTGTTKVNTASTETSTASFSNATVYAFLSTQPQGSQLVYEDLEQLHDDDLEEILRPDFTLSTAMERKRMFRTRNGSKVEYGTAKHESKKVLSENWKEIIIDGSSTADKIIKNVKLDLIRSDMQRMKFSQHGSHWHSQILSVLSILEAPVVKYKESEVLFSEEIALLKRSVGHKEYLMGLVKTELEKVKEEKEGLEFNFKVDKDWKEKFFHPANHIRVEEPKKARENTAAPIIEDWVSDDEEEVEPIPKVEKKTAIPTATKKKSVKPEKPIRRSSSCPNAYKHKVPRAVLMKTGLKNVNNAKPLNTVRYINKFSESSTALSTRSDLIMVLMINKVNTAIQYLMGPIPTTEDTQVEDQEIELGNLSPSYAVSSTPHTRIHKDHPIDHVIGKLTRPTYMSDCSFLISRSTKGVSKALSDPAWGSNARGTPTVQLQMYGIL